MQRKPNEVQMSPEVLERLLAKGGMHCFSAKEGPAGDARITDVRFDHGAGLIVLEYDQEVPESVLVAVAAVE